MKTNILTSIIIVMSISFVNGQSLLDLLNFKDMSFGQIEEKLILENWSFESSENKTDDKSKKMNIIEDLRARTSPAYKSVTYKYVGYLDENTTITIKDEEGKGYNQVKIVSENNRVYKNTVEDLVTANFIVSDEKSKHIPITYPRDYKGGDVYVLETNGKVYKQGNHEVHLLIFRRVVLTSYDREEDKGYYNKNEIMDEYQIIID